MTDLIEKPFSGPAFKVMEEVLCAFTPEGVLLHWNRRVPEVTGFTNEEIEERHFADLVSKEAATIEKYIATVLEEGQTRFEAHVQTKDGELIPYEFSLSLLEHAGHTVICSTGRDISARKQTQKELRASEERYRRLFEDAQEGITITTPEGEIKEVNPAAARILGYSREELLSMNATELYVDPTERSDAAKELRRKGILQGRELRLQRADGKEITCLISTTIRRGDDDASLAFQTFFRDVTEREKAKEALRESEETFRKLAEEALVGIGLIQNGTYKYVNPTLVQITGYPREELLDHSPKRFIHPDDWPQVQKKVKRREKGDLKEVHYETRIKTKSGETRLIEVSGTRVTYRDAPAAIGTIQDITDRRRMQREILQVQEKERRRLGQDLHDSVASQLTGATLKLNLLSRKADEQELEEDIEKAQDLIEESAGDVRRLSRGLNPAGLAEGNLPSALQGLAENTKGASLEQDANLSSLDEETATHLYRITQEAVRNAQKYAEASRIEIRLQQTDDELLLSVEDNGKGFDPDRADEEGFGLRSMRHRAELLGGQLHLDSAPGEGTRVSCRLSL